MDTSFLRMRRMKYAQYAASSSLMFATEDHDNGLSQLMNGIKSDSH